MACIGWTYLVVSNDLKDAQLYNLKDMEIVFVNKILFAEVCKLHYLTSLILYCQGRKVKALWSFIDFFFGRYIYLFIVDILNDLFYLP